VSPHRHEQDDSGTWRSGHSRRDYPPNSESWGVGPRRPRERIVEKHENQGELESEKEIRNFLNETGNLLKEVMSMYEKLRSDVIDGRPGRLLEDRELDEVSKTRWEVLSRLLVMSVAWQGLYIPNSAKSRENRAEPQPPGDAGSAGQHHKDSGDQQSAEFERRGGRTRPSTEDSDPTGDSKSDHANQFGEEMDRLSKAIRENQAILESLRDDEKRETRLLTARTEHLDGLRKKLQKEKDEKGQEKRETRNAFELAAEIYSESLEKTRRILVRMISKCDDRVTLFEELEKVSSRDCAQDKAKIEENKEKIVRRLSNIRERLSEVKEISAEPAEAGAAEEKLTGSLFDLVDAAGALLDDVEDDGHVSKNRLAEIEVAIQDYQAAEAELPEAVTGTTVRASEIPESMAGRLRDLQRDHPELYKAWLRASTGAKPTSRHAAYTSPEP
jgi:uncharacterized membrane-anchored protein YhcB (DUF1043 family)